MKRLLDHADDDEGGITGKPDRRRSAVTSPATTAGMTIDLDVA